MEKTSRRRKLVDINVALKKGLKFYQSRSNATILQETLPGYCIPNVVRTETGKVSYEKVHMSPRPPPQISLKHEWTRKLGSERAQRSEVGQLSRSFQSNQPILSSSRERTVRPVVKDDTKTVQDGRKNVPFSTVSSEKMWRPVVDHDNLSDEQTMLNEVNMDFRIPGLPHSVVKHVQRTSVGELIQKIESHPDRHALQQDLRHNKAYNPFSAESKRMIQDVGNVELAV